MRTSTQPTRAVLLRGLTLSLSMVGFATAGHAEEWERPAWAPERHHGGVGQPGLGRAAGLERILEVDYRWQPVRYVQVSPDYQFIQNPAYNRDRGPARVLSLPLRFNY